MLEKEYMLVLLPLLPSSREDGRDDLGPDDLAYWMNIH